MNYRYIATFILIACSTAYGMHQPKEESYGTYNGEEITSSNLLELLEKEALLDPDVRGQIEGFIERYGIGHILSGADHLEIFFTGSAEERKALAAGIDKELVDNNVPLIENRHSYIINVDNAWVIKRSKVAISRQNVVDTLASMDAGHWTKSNTPYGRILTQEEWQRFNAEPLYGRVYQNISRAMIYLRAREALRTFGITNIHIPETHLVHIPGRPLEVEDTNYVVVELYLGPLTPLSESPLALDEEILTSLVRLTAYTGYWTMGNAVSVDNQGRVYYHDHELPNRHSITDILHRDHERFRDLVKYGWKKIKKQIVKAYAKKHGIDVKELLLRLEKLQNEIMSTWPGQQEQQMPLIPQVTENATVPSNANAYFEITAQTLLFE